MASVEESMNRGLRQLFCPFGRGVRGQDLAGDVWYKPAGNSRTASGWAS